MREKRLSRDNFRLKKAQCVKVGKIGMDRPSQEEAIYIQGKMCVCGSKVKICSSTYIGEEVLYGGKNVILRTRMGLTQSDPIEKFYLQILS